MQFHDFLRDLLNSASLKESTIREIIETPKYYQTFERAFIHKSYEPNFKKNYETLETLGDLAINMAVVNWLLKHKNITNSGELSKTKHKIIGEKQLAEFAEEKGFFKFIKLGDEFKAYLDIQLKNFMEMPRLFESLGEKLSVDDKKKIVQITDYRKILEDTFEAFCGALQMVIDEISGLESGPGYAVCYEFLSKLLQKMDFTNLDVSPPVTTLKEILYDPQGWNSSERESLLIQENDHQTTYDPEKTIKYFKYTYIIPDYPKYTDVGGDTEIVDSQYIALKQGEAPLKTYTFRNKTSYLLGTGYGTDKKQAKNNAAIKSLKIIKDKFGIKK